MNSSYVICILPKAGLGNQLFPLMKAVTFAHLHHLPLKVIGFHQIKIGPYLRGEKIKRKYNGYFTLQTTLLQEWWNQIHFNYFNRLPVITEPRLNTFDRTTNSVYLFNSFDYRDYFGNLREHREVIIPLFWSILSEDVAAEFRKHEHPIIGLHIRRGDYKEAWRTPDEYFINIIRALREMAGANLPVSIFTDGFAYELKNILMMPNVTLVEGNRDIVDLMLLSKSRVIVVSSGSTFGYWASFLSDAPLILPPGHNLTFSYVREQGNKKFYEGILDTLDPWLREQLQQALANTTQP